MLELHGPQRLQGQQRAADQTAMGQRPGGIASPGQKAVPSAPTPVGCSPRQLLVFLFLPSSQLSYGNEANLRHLSI